MVRKASKEGEVEVRDALVVDGKREGEASERDGDCGIAFDFSWEADFMVWLDERGLRDDDWMF